jgi:hypothetical protein
MDERSARCKHPGAIFALDFRAGLFAPGALAGFACVDFLAAERFVASFERDEFGVVTPTFFFALCERFFAGLVTLLEWLDARLVVIPE